MPVTFLDDAASVERARATALGQDDRVEAEPHGAAEIGQDALLRQEIDHRIGRRPIELRRIRGGEPAHVAGELDHCALQAETDAEERDQLLAGVADRADLALDAAIPEATGHQHAVDPREVGRRAVALDRLGVQPLHLDPRLVGDAAVREGFDQALVRILQLDVLADDREAGRHAGMLHASHDVFPPREIARAVRQ